MGVSEKQSAFSRDRSRAAGGTTRGPVAGARDVRDAGEPVDSIFSLPGPTRADVANAACVTSDLTAR